MAVNKRTLPQSTGKFGIVFYTDRAIIKLTSQINAKASVTQGTETDTESSGAVRRNLKQKLQCSSAARYSIFTVDKFCSYFYRKCTGLCFSFCFL